MSRIITKTRTGNIISDEELGLEDLFVGDYGKENNIKASFLGYEHSTCSMEEGYQYQHSIMEQFTKEQQEKIALREQKQREEDLKQLDRLIRKYSDSIVIKVDHYISDNLDGGVIGHRRDYADYEDIEEIKSDIDGNIEIAICVCD